MKEDNPQETSKAIAPVLIPAVAVVMGSLFGFLGGVRTSSIEGDKAIELEKVKFEFSLIQDILSRDISNQEASNELRFLVDIGVIEALNGSALRGIEPDDLPGFRESVTYDITLSTAWGKLHEASEVWDLEGIKSALEELRNGFNFCVTRFASDFLLEIEEVGLQAVNLMPDIKNYYNEMGFCQLPNSGYYAPTKIQEFSFSPSPPVASPSIPYIPRYRERLE